LGQNVNSYRDTSESALSMTSGVGSSLSNPGFRTIYRRKSGGMRFTELLDQVSLVDPNVSKSGAIERLGVDAASPVPFLSCITFVTHSRSWPGAVRPDAHSVHVATSERLSDRTTAADRRPAQPLHGGWGRE